MKKLLTSMFLCLFLLASVSAFGAAAKNDFLYFQNVLNNLCMIGYCDERPNPYLADGATNIIANSVILAYYDNQDKIEQFNKPLHSMGLEYSNIIPANLVNEAVCRYYGFTVAKYPELEKAAQNRSLNSEYYFLGSGDPAMVDFKVEKIAQLKNGLVVASGVEVGDGDPSPFKAFFKKSNCGGKAHWVPLKVVFLKIYQEQDNYNVPVDE